MSADNWTTCPDCHKKKPCKSRNEKLTEAYGKMSADDFAKLVETAVDDVPERNLREDYELGMDEDGRFSVTYSCGCRVCGFAFRFKHQERAKGVPS